MPSDNNDYDDDDDESPLLPLNKPSPPLISPAPPFSLAAQIGLSIGCDIPWALSSFKNWCWPLSPSAKPQNTWLNEAGAGATGLLATSIGMFAFNPKFRGRLGVTVLGMYASASLLSLLAWNYGQLLGTNMGQDSLGMSAEEAGYFSSLHAGVFEAAVQAAVISVASALLQRTTAKACAKDALKCFLLTLPGGITWQVVFQATYQWAQENIPQLLLSAGAVALSSAAISLLANKLQEKIISAIENCQRKEKEFDHSQEQDDYDSPNELPLRLSHP